jgi:hypothetical protein
VIFGVSVTLLKKDVVYKSSLEVRHLLSLAEEPQGQEHFLSAPNFQSKQRQMRSCYGTEINVWLEKSLTSSFNPNKRYKKPADQYSSPTSDRQIGVD